MEHDEGGKPADELADGSQSDTSGAHEPGEDTNSGGGPAEPATQNPQE
jgi:hypothetical protein